MDDIQRTSPLAANAPYICFALLSVCLVSLYLNLSARILAGVTTFLIPTREDIARERTKAKKGGRTKNRGGREGGAAVSSSFPLGLNILRLNKESVGVLTFYTELDSLLVVATMAMATCAAGAVGPNYLGLRENGLIYPSCTFAMFLALSSMFIATWKSEYTPVIEKIIAGGFGLLCTGLMFPTLYFGHNSLSFQIEQAAESLGPWLQNLLSKTRMPLHPLSLSPTTVMGMLSLVSGMLASILVSPAVRSARGLALAVTPPDWGAKQLRARWFVVLGFQVETLLTLVIGTLWLAPIVHAPLSAIFGSDGVEVLRPLCLICLAVLQLLLAKGYVQSFMNAVIVTWYEGIHSVCDSEEEIKRLDRKFRHKIEMSNMLMGKVALQVCAPAVLQLAGGLLLVVVNFADVFYPSLSQTEAAIPNTFWVTLVSFIAWWSALVTSFVRILTLSLIRNGTLSF